MQGVTSLSTQRRYSGAGNGTNGADATSCRQYSSTDGNNVACQRSEEEEIPHFQDSPEKVDGLLDWREERKKEAAQVIAIGNWEEAGSLTEEMDRFRHQRA